MLSSKLLTISPSYTIAISNQVKELIGAGIPVTNLTIGEPDFNTPQKIKQKAIEGLKGNYTRYDYVAGMLALRQAIQAKFERDNRIKYDLDEILVSSGAKHAITNALMALINPGDQVLLAAPYWTSYPEMIKLAGGFPLIIEGQQDHDYKLTADLIRQYASESTKAILINNPANPTGSVYSQEELEAILEVCLEKKLYILSDEIYEAISFNDRFISIASLSQAAREITITINGFSKAYAMTGWRLAYTGSSKKICQAMTTIQGHLVSHPSTISQYAGIAALNECDQEKKQMVDTYKERLDKLLLLMDDLQPITYVKPQGAFYLFICIDSLRDHYDHDQSLSLQVAKALLDNYHLAVVPGIAFGMDNHVRITFATNWDTIQEGFHKLKAYLKDLL